MALNYVKELEGKSEFDFGEISYNQAIIYANLGETDTALELLRRSVLDGSKFYYANVFENDPTLISIRDHPEFSQIIYPMKE